MNAYHPFTAVSILLALAVPRHLAAQAMDDLPVEHVEVIPPGGLVDLDSGAILPTAKIRGHQADFRFDRDGSGFFLQGLLGAQPAPANATAPDAGSWSDARIRVQPRSTEPIALFVRTDRGIARATVTVVDPYSTASAVLRWAVLPAAAAVFPPQPTDVESKWQGDELVLTWTGEAASWLVEVTGDAERKETTTATRSSLRGLRPDGHYRIRVRALQDGTISLPAELVRFGREAPSRRFVVDYPGRWYDASGGLGLATAAIATESADVVFYLYGVYVPGGGVAKIGTGEEAFQRAVRVPDGPFPPSYGRLDDNDVLAIELPDGRCGLLWLEPARDGDLRSGMHVHVTFLPDGRRALLAPPTNVTTAVETGVQTLRWQPAVGATSYRVELAGAKPTTTPECTMRWPALAADRVFTVAVTALSGTGDESPPATVRFHTFGADARLGRAILPAQNGGLVFATGVVAPNGRPDLALVGGAGGSASLVFSANGTFEPGGKREFGDFTGLAGAGKEGAPSEWRSDVRESDSELFFVHTADGGCACVRIAVRDWPDTEIEYLWRPARR